ncbi:hypothetical protein CJ030_MR4G013719 [Morella rubra]|uniref:Uncharacterized protein n=1 Tax=Morella rubra TaxID=262757 RepID=A0A6A1WWQ2_9ROSI|nr:hypothetical protein CJ030_MR4G013719 [Morella rubra]
MELTVRNIPIIFLPDELANFLKYERDLMAFPNLPMSKEGRPTKAEVFRTMLGDDTTILEGSFMVHGQLLPFWRIMHLILCSSIDPKKHTTELSYSRAEFLCLVVVWGLPVDIASYIYLSIRAEALKTDATISLPHGILLTQFLHAMMVPESGDELRALPLGSINKTTLSKSIAQTRRALQAARVARKVTDMDVGWKKEITTLKEVLKGVATGAELFPLTERVVLRSTFVTEHLEEMRRESPINVDRRHEEEFPLWFRNRDDVMPAGGKRLRCDSSVRAESSPDTLAVSGPSLRDRNKLPSPDTASPVGTQSSCASYMTHRNRMFHHYPVFNSKEEAVKHPYPEMNKEEWTRVCDLFTSEEFQRRSAINKENRAKLKIVHTSGARSFQRTRALLVRYGADDARASTDDGGAATEERRRADAMMAEQQRKKDEEHRKMMEEQQRTLVE